MNSKILVVSLLVLISWSCKKEEIIQTKLHSFAPSHTGGKINESFGCVQLDRRDIEIELWDNSTPDGDNISLFINGNEVLSNHRVTTKYNNKFKLNYTLDYNGYNHLVLLADGVGDYKHCELGLTINGQRKTLLSTLETNSYLDLIVGNQATCNSEYASSNIMFWASGDPGCGNISVRFEGFESKYISTYYIGITPDCKADGSATFENLSAGTYHYTVQCGTEADITVDGTNRCYKINLGV